MTRRSATLRANQAADALDAYLRERPAPLRPPRVERAAVPHLPEAMDSGFGADPPADTAWLPAVLADDGAAGEQDASSPLMLPNPDWLHHHLAVTGPGTLVAAFRHAAAGAGTVPWQLDEQQIQEDLFLLLANPATRTLSLHGARVLAGQLRGAVSRRHALAVARVGHSRACPFDLQALLPVPAGMLQLGPDHPQALGWLWRHWGTTQALRQVAAQPTAIDATGHGRFEISFWAADWTPWQAFIRLRLAWPSLSFDVRPDYASA